MNRNEKHYIEQYAADQLKEQGLPFPSKEWADAYLVAVKEAEAKFYSTRNEAPGHQLNLRSWVLDELEIVQGPPPKIAKPLEVEVRFKLQSNASFNELRHPENTYWPVSHLVDLLQEMLENSKPPKID